MKWQPILAAGIVIVGVLFLLFLPGLSFHRHTQQDVIQQVFGNQKTFDAVMSSPQVTAQLLKDSLEEGVPLLAPDDKYQPVLLSPDQTQKIKELLGKSSSYGWGYMSGCIPHYGVVFNFQSGDHAVRVAFCFHCDMVAVIDGADDNFLGSGHPFDPMRKEMLAMCKRIFPNSESIQDFK